MALETQLTIPHLHAAPRGHAAARGHTARGSMQRPVRPVAPVRATPSPPRRNGVALAAQAREILAEAADWVDADERFRLAHLSALRTAAALFADRARPAVRQRPTNAWVLLTQVAPELADWAGYFAAGASQRAAIEAGAHHVVTQREADDLVRAVSEFLAMVEVSLGVFTSARAS
jgi:hypothetical protein